MRRSTKVQLKFSLAQVSLHLTMLTVYKLHMVVPRHKLPDMSNISTSRMFGLAKDGQNLLSSKVLNEVEAERELRLGQMLVSLDLRLNPKTKSSGNRVKEEYKQQRSRAVPGWK